MALAWSDNSNAPFFVLNGPKLAKILKFDQAQKLLFPAELHTYSHFRKNRKFWFQFRNYFFAPRRAFLMEYFYPRNVVAYPLGKQVQSSEAFSFLRINSAKILNAYFPVQIHFSALCVGSSTSLFLLRRTTKYQTSYRNIISMALLIF